MATPEENLYLAAAAILSGAIPVAFDNNWSDEQLLEYSMNLANDLAGRVKRKMTTIPDQRKKGEGTC